MKPTHLLAALAATFALSGCNPATDRSRTITKEELSKYQNKQAQSVDSRTDLSPQQKEALKRYYGGGAPGGGGPQGGPPATGR